MSALHPGGENLWKCDICKVETSTQAALVKHLQNQCQTRINKYKCVSDFSSDSALSVGTHKRYCQGSALQDKEYKCTHCSFSLGTENGLKVHTSRVYPNIYNATPKEKKVFAWTEVQLEFLAEFLIDFNSLEGKENYKAQYGTGKIDG